MLDLTTNQGKHIDQRLRQEQIIWLVSVRPDNRPHLVPVWFYWDGDKTILIFSEPKNQKVRNLRQNQNVSLALNAANDGEDIVILEGQAELFSSQEDIPQALVPEYTEKYASSMEKMGLTTESIVKTYSQAIRVKLTRVIGWNE